MAPHQFSKPRTWNADAHYILQVYLGAKMGVCQYTFVTRSAALTALSMHSWENDESALWQVIRKEGEETRLRFLSYLPSFNTTWD